MLKYDFNEKELKIINAYLVTHSSNRDKNIYDLTWDSSLFFSRIILETVNPLDINNDVLTREIKSYNKKRNTSVSLTFLLNHFWIRSILDQYKIPMAILHICIGSKEEQKMPQNITDKELSENFQFIIYLAQKYGYEDSRKSFIPTSIFDSIYESFKNIFLKIPPLETILDEYKIEKKDDKYYLNFWIIEGKIDQKKFSSHLLYSLLNNQDPSNDVKIITAWLHFSRFIFYPEVYLKLPEYYSDRYLKAAFSILKNENDLIDDHDAEKYFLDEALAISHFYTISDILNKQGLSNYTIKSDNIFIKWLKIFNNRDYGVDFLDIYIREDYIKLLQSLLHNSVINIDSFDITELYDQKSFLLFQTIYYFKRTNPVQLLRFIDHKKYGLIFFCSFLLVIEDYFTENKKVEPYLAFFVDRIIKIFYEKNIAINNDYSSISLLLMFILERLFNSKWFEFYNGIFNTIKSFEKFIIFSSEQINLLLDSYKKHSSQIWVDRISKIKICNFQYLFLLYNHTAEENRNHIFEQIHSLYNESIEKNEIFSYWNEWNHLDTIEWDLFYNNLYEKGLLDNFCLDILNHLNFDTAESNYDKKNSTPQKLRVHLKIMCLVYQKWAKYENEIKIHKLESNILSILEHCFNDKPSYESVNIFNLMYESSFGLEFKTELFPVIISTISRFSTKNKSTFFFYLSHSDELRLLVKAYNLLSNLDDKDLLKKNLNNLDKIDSKVFAFTDYIDLIRDLYNSHIDDKFTDNLLDKLDGFLNKKKNVNINEPYAKDIEILKLYRLFFKKEKLELINYNLQHKESFDLDIENKRVYLLVNLLLDEKNFEAAKTNLFLLSKRKIIDLKNSILYMYVRSLLNEGNSTCIELLKNVEKVFEEKKLDQEGYNYLILTKENLLSSLNKHNELISYFNTLNSDYQKTLNFAKPVIKALIDQGKNKDAVALFYNIEKKDSEINEYETLKNEIPWSEQILTLSKAYSEILTLKIYDRFKVLPPSINDHNNDLGQYLVGDLCFSLNYLLKKIKAVRSYSDFNNAIKSTQKKFSGINEDYKTDLLRAIMSARLTMLDYKLDEQNRSGQSAKGINSGELDLSIDLGCSTAVIEALNCKGWSNDIKQHIEKTFKYDPTNSLHINLMYYEGKNRNFCKNWELIKQKITDSTIISYPSMHAYKSQKDISGLYKNNCLKVLKCEHDGDLIFYHIFANFSYID